MCRAFPCTYTFSSGVHDEEIAPLHMLKKLLSAQTQRDNEVFHPDPAVISARA